MGILGNIGNWLNPFSGNEDYKIYDPRTWSLNPAKDLAGAYYEARHDAAGSAATPLDPQSIYNGVTNARNNAAGNALSQSQTDLANLQAQQYAQRQKDIDRALSYFQPYDQLMYNMYGVRFPGTAVGTPGMVSAAMNRPGSSTPATGTVARALQDAPDFWKNSTTAPGNASGGNTSDLLNGLFGAGGAGQVSPTSDARLAALLFGKG